jgi:4-amino-4-deoxy-L-arabinose transferase-like glycosyltransferase
VLGEQRLTEAQGRRGRLLAPARREALVTLAVAAVVAAIVVGAIAVRFVSLSSQPGGLYPDEGAEALDAHRLLHTPGFHPIFFHDDGGREALYAYVVAGAFRVFGESPTVLRGVSAALGILAVLTLYPALRRFGRGVALAGMAWAAGALWLICISRDGMRNILVPLFAALAIWALARWADHPARSAAIVAGAVAGAGLWTYQPLKLTPALLALWLVWMRRQDPGRYRALMADLPWFVAAYVVLAAPMLVTAIVDPRDYFGRAAGVSPLNPANGGINLAWHTLQTLGMFNITGDPNARHNVASLPMLGWPLFALACAGAWRAWRHRTDPGHTLLLVGLPVFMLPPLLGVDGWAPHFLRSVGLAPIVAGLVGLGCVEAVNQARRVTGRRWAGPLVAGLMAVLLAGLGAGSATAYFSRPIDARYQAYSYDVVALAAAAQSGDAVIIDDYNRIDIDFLDAGRGVQVFAPGSRIRDPQHFSRVLALSRQDVAAAVGEAIASRAQPVPAYGRSAFWSVTP